MHTKIPTTFNIQPNTPLSVPQFTSNFTVYKFGIVTRGEGLQSHGHLGYLLYTSSVVIPHHMLKLLFTQLIHNYPLKNNSLKAAALLTALISEVFMSIYDFG